jgi:hypothetical protein
MKREELKEQLARLRKLVEDNNRKLKEAGKVVEEGAWTNEGLYWIDPEGKIHTVNALKDMKATSMSHEEWANTVMHVSLEKLLKSRWIRVQSLPGTAGYLYIDHRQRSVGAGQAAALASFFFTGNYEPIPYKQYVIERFHNDMRDFTHDQFSDAYEFAMTGEIPSEAGFSAY